VLLHSDALEDKHKDIILRDIFNPRQNRIENNI